MKILREGGEPKRKTRTEKPYQYSLIMMKWAKTRGRLDQKRVDSIFVPTDKEARKIARSVMKSHPGVNKWELFKKIDGGAR